MEHSYVRLLIISFCVLLSQHIRAYDDGLWFNSHQYDTERRTTLLLNEGEPLDVKGRTDMSFNMDLRERPFFGNIFCIKTGDGRHIDAIFSIQDGDKYKPALVIDGKLYQISYDVQGGENIPVSITMDKSAGRITFTYAGHKVTATEDLTKTTSARIAFGKHPYEDNFPDVAPMNVRDIVIKYDGTEKHSWSLRRHKENVSEDSHSNMKALAGNGHWLIDDHITWKNVFTYKSNDKLQIAYNPDDNIFYIVESNTVKCYNPVSGKTQTVRVSGGHRAMMYSNYIGYSTQSKCLYTYNLQRKLFARFDFATGQWSNSEAIADEPVYGNHTTASAADTVTYVFGGYGFYRYHNNLFRITPADGRMEELDYQPRITPRTWASSALVGDKLYIFGGYGNDSGEQELPSVYYYDMSCIDLKTMKMTRLWTMEGEQKTSFQLSSEMLWNAADSTFYAGVTNSSGRLIKIWLNEPKWKIATNPMKNNFGYKDLTFNIYQSNADGKIYAVVNRRMNNLTHEVVISSIALPVPDDIDFDTPAENSKAGNRTWLVILLSTLAAGIVIAAVSAVVMKKKRKNKKNNKPAADTYARTAAERQDDTACETHRENDDDSMAEEPQPEEAVKYYAPETSSIQMLGKFVVKDKEGNDITSQFTKRTRNLLIMLLLHSETSEKGIEIHRLDETLWQEMDDESARNNRNVYMRKLRVLLEKVGDAEIVNDKIYYRVNLGSSVFFDYHEVTEMMKRLEYEDNTDGETSARTLELLFEGPLLPNYSFEWLDKFKSDYSNAAISLLTRRLNREVQNGNDVIALKIAKTILLHDPFSDKALATQCSILCRRHKKGIAKNVYDNFCKNYETCIGEKYHISFAEVCK